MKTYILNLPSAHERRAFQSRQAEQLGLHAVFIDACTPADIPQAVFQASAFSWERPIKITEVACFLSHHAIWEKIAVDDAPALILEDDAVLACNTPNLLKSLQTLKNIDHISLETRRRKKLLGPSSIACPDARAVLRPLLQDRTGAAAYVLWPSGARQLLAKFQSLGMGLADAFISSTYSLRSWQTVPAFAIQADVATVHGVACPIAPHSLIAREKVPSPPTRGWAQSIRLKLRRLSSQMRLAWRFISCMPRARRCMVDIDVQAFSKSLG